MLIYFVPWTNSKVLVSLILSIDILVAAYLLILVVFLLHLYHNLLSTTSALLLELKTPRDALKTSKWIVTTNLASKLVPLLILVISLFLATNLLDALQYFIPSASSSLVWATDYLYWVSILPDAGLGVTIFYFMDQSSASVHLTYTQLLQNMALPDQKSVVVVIPGKTAFEPGGCETLENGTLEAGGVTESLLPPRLLEISGDTWRPASNASDLDMRTGERVFGGSGSGFERREVLDSILVDDGCELDLGGEKIVWPTLEVAYSSFT